MNKSSSLSRSVLLLILLHFAWIIGTSSPAIADEFLPRTNPKFKQAEEVYRSLIRAVGDSRTPPELRMVRGRSSVFDIAMFAPKQHRVLIEERFVDLTQRLPPSDGPHALALILGHELAHFYRSHPWALEFGNAFANRQRQSEDGGAASTSGHVVNREERRRLESEADYFGGFYSFLAGYHPLRIASTVFDAVYREYQFDKSLSAYEHLEDRKAAAQEAQARLRQLEPLFDAGIFLSLLKDHLNAARVFDRIAADFPGPEILNNAGASLANESLRWFTDTERRFLYPLTLDSETRLASDASRGGDADASERLERRSALLEQALERFERAVALLPGYVSGMVNIACVLDLLGRHEAALQKAREALALLERDAANDGGEAAVIAGIAAAHLGRDDEARRAFLSAGALGSPLAEGNLSVLKGRDEMEAQPEGSDQKPFHPARIGGVDITELRVGNVLADPGVTALARWQADDEHPELQIFRTKQGSTLMTIILRGDAAKRSAGIFLSDDQAVTNAGHELAVGLPVSRVEARYGKPSSVYLSRQGRSYVYEGRYHGHVLGLIIRLDRGSSVRNWAAFRIEE
ncbi:MAG TPA: tetratricopeptide repeat protein [Nitrospira sp.]